MPYDACRWSMLADYGGAVKLEAMGDWAGAAVALIGAAFVWTQILIQRSQHRLQEAETHRLQATAWASLSQDWEIAQLVAAGQSAVRRFGLPVAMSKDFLASVEEFRAARVLFLDFAESGEASEDEWEKYEERIAEATSRLGPYQRSVQKVITHLAQVSGLVLSGRLSTEVAYNALGIQLLHLRRDLPNLMREGYALRSSCPGPLGAELALWRELSVEEVALRIGWGDFLAVARATAERISVFIDLLTAHAVQMGDLGPEVADHESLPPGAELNDLDRLAIAWRAGRRVSLRRAIGVVAVLSKTGRRARRADVSHYPQWVVLSRYHYPPPWIALPVKFVRFCWDALARPADVIRAAWKARDALDVRRLVPPHEYGANRDF
ncbi:hypothetical protein ACFWDZ_32350 [Micromonospora aurantiaca]|uniref:hypothetical protein n=1 Tax=Micromonospora aurantiaca (nom. illeg.) TaxID=47850 RepID=UPI0013C35F5B|nr:hypothetical protein [Micromonospora aurantiaca]